MIIPGPGYGRAPQSPWGGGPGLINRATEILSDKAVTVGQRAAPEDLAAELGTA